MPASGASEDGRVTASSRIGTLSCCHSAASSNVWLAHIAISGQDFWQSLAGPSSGQHGMPSAIFMDEGIGFATAAHDWANGPATTPARALISKKAESRDRNCTG